jgi:hypothetical protein
MRNPSTDRPMSFGQHRQGGGAGGGRFAEGNSFNETLPSATSLLLTRELGYGLGPTSSRFSVNYTMKSIRYAQ